MNVVIVKYDVLFQMEEARLYHGKLVNIKKTMLMLHERTADLKVGLVWSQVGSAITLATI